MGLGEPEVGSRGLGLVGSGLGEPGLEDSELCDGDGDGDGDAEVALSFGEVVECGAALLMAGLQPASATIAADTAIADQIRFGFTSKLLYLLVT